MSETHHRPGNAQLACEQDEERGVGGAIGRRRGDPHEQGTVVADAIDAVAAAAWRQPDGEPDLRHGRRMQQTRNGWWTSGQAPGGTRAQHHEMEPLVVLVVAAATLLASGLAVSALPVGQCDECEHCRRLKLEHEQEQRRLRAEYARQWGIRTKERGSDSDDDR